MSRAPSFQKRIRELAIDVTPLALGGLLVSADAWSCTLIVDDLPYEVRPGGDTVPPAPPSGVSVAVRHPFDAEPCDACYGAGYLKVTFIPGTDDVTPTAELGYLVTVVSGAEADFFASGLLALAPGELNRDFLWDEHAVDIVATIATVDRAGNVSEAIEFTIWTEGHPYRSCDGDTAADPGRSPAGRRREGARGCGCASSGLELASGGFVGIVLAGSGAGVRRRRRGVWPN